MLASAASLPVTLALLVLLVWNLHLLFHNRTTIEHHEGVRLAAAAAAVGSGGGGGGGGGPAGAAAAAAAAAAGSLGLAERREQLPSGIFSNPGSRKPSALNLAQLAAGGEEEAAAAAPAAVRQQQQQQQQRQANQQQQGPGPPPAPKYGRDQHPYDLLVGGRAGEWQGSGAGLRAMPCAQPAAHAGCLAKGVTRRCQGA